VSTVILEAAGSDPRYLLLLPGLFTAPEGDPYPNVADNLDALFVAEEKYPADLQRCQSVDPLDPPPVNRFTVFNPCLQLDARGITPFLPYVIRGDLLSLLDVDEIVSCLIHRTDLLLTPLQVGNQSPLSGVGPGLGCGASFDREEFSLVPGDPPCDADGLGTLYWDFKTITTTASLVALALIIVGVLATYFLGFY
jgi:hypothetical protein